MDKYEVFIEQFYKDVAIEINEMAAEDGLSVLPMSVMDMNIDIDDNRLLVWLDEDSRVVEFQIG